jgi:hypothetical protein
VVVAEAKPHAVTIMHNNGSEADHICKDIDYVANRACWRCSAARKVPKIEADRLVAGYTCQQDSLIGSTPITIDSAPITIDTDRWGRSGIDTVSLRYGIDPVSIRDRPGVDPESTRIGEVDQGSTRIRSVIDRDRSGSTRSGGTDP